MKYRAAGADGRSFDGEEGPLRNRVVRARAYGALISDLPTLSQYVAVISVGTILSGLLVGISYIAALFITGQL